MNIEIMKKLWNYSQKDSRYLIYIDDGERTNFVTILKDDKTDIYYYRFLNDDESVIRNLADLDENQVAVYSLMKEWSKKND